MNDGIDYKLLLEKYMRHVRQCEGVTFADRINEEMTSDVRFSVEEKSVIEALDEKIEADPWENR